MRWLPTSRNMHTGRICSPTRPWLSSTAAPTRLSLCSCCSGPRNACATTSTSVPGGLSGHVTVDKQVEEACHYPDRTAEKEPVDLRSDSRPRLVSGTACYQNFGG